MSMEHKAFLFETSKFFGELAPIIFRAARNNDKDLLRSFINSRIGVVRSPYTGEFLKGNWEQELENGDLQELADFAMTCYYNPQEDRGLGYDWDPLLESLRMSSTAFDPGYVILGRQITDGQFVLDPGRMGTGIVQAEDVPGITVELRRLKPDMLVRKIQNNPKVLYPVSEEEFISSCRDLDTLYQDAARSNKGLLMTF
jgi:hypothetical protein